MSKLKLQVNVRLSEEEFKKLNYIRFHLNYTTISKIVRDLILEKHDEIKLKNEHNYIDLEE